MKHHLHFLGKWSYLNCAWRYFSFQPLDFERAIFEDPTAVFRLKIWKVCCCSIVPYTADVICLFDFFFDDRGARVVMSSCPFSLHRKSKQLWYLAYISSRIFQKDIIHRIWLFHPIHFEEKFLNVSYLLLAVSFSPISLNTFITIAFFPQLFQGIDFPFTTKWCCKIAPSESMITR